MQVRRSFEIAVGIGVAAAFAGNRLWQGLTGVALVWQDTQGYQESALWAGVRPPVAPILWDLTGTPRSYVVVQTLVGIAAWCFLAWTVAMLAKTGWPRLVAGAVVLAFASTTPIILWDRSVLSESLAFSLLALLFATAIRVTQRVTWPRVAALVAASAGFALVRDSLVWMVVGLAVAIAAYAIVRNAGRKAVALGFLLLAVSGFAIVGQAAAHRNTTNVEHVLFARIFPFPERVKWFADHGMPNQAEVLSYAAATKTERGQPRVVGIVANDPTVQPLVRWMRNDAIGVYLEWLALHPGFVLTEPLREPERAFNNAEGRLDFYAAVDRTDLSVVNTLFDPGPWIVLAATLVAVGIGLVRQVWRERWWRMIALLLGLSVMEILVAWHGDATETTRHGIVGSVSVRLAVVVLIVAGALAPSSPEAEVRGTRVRSRLTFRSGTEPDVPSRHGDGISVPGRI